MQIDQANADKNIAQAKAEERRAMAVRFRTGMKLRHRKHAAKVIEAEAEVPKAMAEAFRSGNLGIMDYYRMKNNRSRYFNARKHCQTNDWWYHQPAFE